MTKKEKAIMSIGAMIGGGILCGFSMARAHPNPIPTILVVVGLAFAVCGFISLVLVLKSPTANDK